MLPLVILGLGILFLTLSGSAGALDSRVLETLGKVDPRFVRRAGSVMLLAGVPYRILLHWTGVTPGGARDLRNAANQRAIVRELTDQGAKGVEVQTDNDGNGWISYLHIPNVNLAVTFGVNVYGSGKLYAAIREDGKAWS